MSYEYEEARDPQRLIPSIHAVGLIASTRFFISARYHVLSFSSVLMFTSKTWWSQAVNQTVIFGSQRALVLTNSNLFPGDVTLNIYLVLKHIWVLFTRLDCSMSSAIFTAMLRH